MLSFVKTISSEIDSLNRRVVKFLRLGNNDVQTSLEALPFGFDSSPPKDLVAVYGPTQEKGKTVIIGYLNKNQIALPGESRLFSIDENGVLKIFVHLTKEGVIKMGGDAKNMVRFQEMEAAFNELKADYNDLESKWSAFAAAYVPGSPVFTGTPPTAASGSQATADISGAKIEEIKTL